jgi:hypothetical protein
MEKKKSACFARNDGGGGLARSWNGVGSRAFGRLGSSGDVRLPAVLLVWVGCRGVREKSRAGPGSKTEPGHPFTLRDHAEGQEYFAALGGLRCIRVRNAVGQMEIPANYLRRKPK